MKTLALTAQDIVIQNPSMEGPPRAGSVPSPWIRAFQSPDTQPGFYGITLLPSQGKTYVGAIYGTAWMEGVSQQLISPMKAGTSYQLSFDLAAPAKYDTLQMCGGSMAVYGSNSATAREELLWASGSFTHEQWKRYTVILRPTKDYNYLVLMPYLPGTCGASRYTSCLIDNLSGSLAAIPTISFQIQPACRGRSTGSIMAQATHGKPPYTYLWTYNGATQASIDQLPVGDYEVTVTSVSGTSAKAVAHVNDYTMNVHTINTLPSCYGDKNGIIEVKVENGIPPYRYSKDEGQHFQDHPEFKELRAGAYAFLIKDQMKCEARSSNTLAQPDPLELQKIKTRDVTCTATTDGKIVLDITGGTQPYIYSLNDGIWQEDNAWKNLDAGNYHFRIKDINNCFINGNADIIRNIRACAVFVPTAFSPNGDGQNDLFRAKVNDDVHDYRLAVYSRWGQIVFMTTDPEGAWNGDFKGRQLPMDVYAWVLTYTDSKQQGRKQTGSVTLLR
ncbi:gliding motility-associated C-terminal domain-containing protein [Chitinophaga niastensis]|nr:gliding motility-associated C-terminal domain-containing protein [Chitinophaga niastensis]